MLRASMMYTLGRAYGLPYKVATFHSKKGLFNTVYTDTILILVHNGAEPNIFVSDRRT